MYGTIRSNTMTRPYTLAFTGPLDALLSFLVTERTSAAGDTPEAFVRPTYAALHDPSLLHDMDKAVATIMAAMAAQARIAIFSDYDCDGIPGGVVLHDFFTAAQYTNFTNVIPHRHYDGFGLSVTAVEAMAAAGVAVIITVDCGTTDSAAIARAAALGVAVVVTDHHEPPAILPEAAALVNPKLGSYPFPHLCGAAVAFKLAQALLATGAFAVSPGQEKWWLDLVGLATIADMVPLVGENRVLAHYGLVVLRQSRRPGLQQLLRKARLPQAYLTEEDIGFTIGPRVNAASRMDAPEHAFRLLATRDEAEAVQYAERLEQLNNERKGQVAAMTRDIHTKVALWEQVPPVIVLGDPLWRPALVGLAATKLAEEHGRPVFLWGRDGNGVLKGSCRSGGTLSVVALMTAVSHCFHEYGGHHASGGFAVQDAAIHTLGDALSAAADQLAVEVVAPPLPQVTAVLTPDEVEGVWRDTLTVLAPFGAGNPKPLFALEGVMPLSVERFGKEQEHLKVVLPTKRGSLEAVAFFVPAALAARVPVRGASCTLLAHIEASFFMGRRSIRLRIVDIV